MSTSSPTSLQNTEEPTYISSFLELKFFHGFVASLSVIIASELGDKTFLIAAILAVKSDRITVFMSAFLALIIMTCLSVALGMFTSFIPKEWVHYVSVGLFLIFGIKMIIDGYYMTGEEDKEEYEQVQKELENTQNKEPTSQGVEAGLPLPSPTISLFTKIKRKLMILCSLVFIETFILIFLAEWGDRSQISTFLLSAREDPIGVAIGAILGHFICTAIAVIAGRLVAQLISIKSIMIIDGIIFIIFALSALILDS